MSRHDHDHDHDHDSAGDSQGRSTQSPGAVGSARDRQLEEPRPAERAGCPAGPGESQAVKAGEWESLGAPWAEAAVLGCLLRATPAAARALLDALCEQDWTVPQHRHVAAAARALLEHDQPVDALTVLGQLRRQGLEDARTSSKHTAVLLVELCEAAPVLSNAEHYARIVLEHSYRRRLQRAAVRLADAADRLPLDQLAPLLEREVAAVTHARHRATVSYRSPGAGEPS